MGDEKKKDDLDAFWDIDKLIPQRKQPAVFRAHTYDTEPVEVILKAKESTASGKLATIEMRPEQPEESKLTFAPQVAQNPDPDDEYSPDNPFIKSVRIFKRSDFGYYSAFYKDGIDYLELEGNKCPEPSYFSWVPQYSQLDPDQMEFYLYMRSELRKGRTISASYSYILLYIFELINVEPKKEYALSQLSFVWHSYREKFPKLDPLMKEWITDFCLIHHLLPSTEQLGEAFKVALEGAMIKELYICAGKTEDEMISSPALASALLEYCTNYNWRSSKFATPENIPLYEKHTIGALRAVLSNLRGKNGVFVGLAELKRDAFSNALCTPENKYKIEVSYFSISRSHEMRFLITDVIKHTENRIRAYIGVKSRLTVYSLPVDVRKCIDEYMDNNLAGKRAPKKAEEHQEYDKLYDVPKREFSLENARMIEEASWNTTKILVEAFEGDEELIPLEIDNKDPKPILPKEEAVCFDCEMSDEERLLKALAPNINFILFALEGNAYKQEAYAREMGRMLDSLADEINEISAEVYGDIILEKDGNAYTVIEDYKEMFDNARDK